MEPIPLPDAPPAPPDCTTPPPPSPPVPPSPPYAPPVAPISPVAPVAPPPPAAITSIVLLELFQSPGTVHEEPEVMYPWHCVPLIGEPKPQVKACAPKGTHKSTILPSIIGIFFMAP